MLVNEIYLLGDFNDDGYMDIYFEQMSGANDYEAYGIYNPEKKAFDIVSYDTGPGC